MENMNMKSRARKRYPKKEKKNGKDNRRYAYHHAERKFFARKIELCMVNIGHGRKEEVIEKKSEE